MILERLFLACSTVGSLSAGRIPSGLLNLAFTIYSLAMAVGRNDVGEVNSLSGIFKGVFHGCPLAGLFFILSIDPFLNEMKSKIEGVALGVMRACADDIGVALRRITGLKILICIFRRAAKFAGMELKRTYSSPSFLPRQSAGLRGVLTKLTHGSGIMFLNGLPSRYVRLHYILASGTALQLESISGMTKFQNGCSGR